MCYDFSKFRFVRDSEEIFFGAYNTISLLVSMLFFITLWSLNLRIFTSINRWIDTAWSHSVASCFVGPVTAHFIAIGFIIAGSLFFDDTIGITYSVGDEASSVLLWMLILY